MEDQLHNRPRFPPSVHDTSSHSRVSSANAANGTRRIAGNLGYLQTE
jgi:hypothetical protein